MDKQKARKMYELADRLSQVDTSKLNEQQLAERAAMVQRLGEELKAMKLDELSPKLLQRAAIKAKGQYDNIRQQFSDRDSGKMSPDAPPEAKQAADAKYDQFDRIYKGYDKAYKRDQARAQQAQIDAAGGLSLAFKRKMAMQRNRPQESVDKGVVEGFASPDQEARVRARLKELEDLDPDNMYKIVADEFDMTEDELRNALHDESMSEAEEDLHTSYNVAKLGGALNADPRTLRAAIQRHMQGTPTRTDIMTLANAFMGMLTNSDDRQIQMIANLIKAGNPRAVPQESTAAIAERTAFVDALLQVKQGEKFTVGGKEYTKTTSYGDDENDDKKVDESLDTEAYDRLKRVFDFSDYKG